MPDPSSRCENLFVCRPGAARFKVGKPVSSPDRVRMRIDESRNNRPSIKIDSFIRAATPFDLAASPGDASVCDCKRSMTDDLQMRHFSTMLRAGTNRCDEFRNACQEQCAHLVPPRLGMSRPRSAAIAFALSYPASAWRMTPI